jgi:hypothetical protein
MHDSREHWIIAAALAAVLFAGSWACKTQEEAAQDESGPPVSAFGVASPRARAQLLNGFWEVENHAWRWTRHTFSVSLMPPPAAARLGANLEFRFTLTDGVIARRRSVTLAVSVGEVALPPETYTASGSYLYKAEVPAAAFHGADPVAVVFKTDKYLASGEVESRELALIAQSFALTPR